MGFREDISSDSEQIEKARQDLLLACQEAADRAQQEQEQKTFSEVPQKPQEIPLEVNFETTQATDEESVITIEQVDPDETDQSVPAETDEISLTVQPENIEPEPTLPGQPPQNGRPASLPDQALETAGNPNTSPNISSQNQQQKAIPPHRNHNPFVEDILKGIVSEDINRLRQQIANKP